MATAALNPIAYSSQLDWFVFRRKMQPVTHRSSTRRRHCMTVKIGRHCSLVFSVTVRLVRLADCFTLNTRLISVPSVSRTIHCPLELMLNVTLRRLYRLPRSRSYCLDCNRDLHRPRLFDRPHWTPSDVLLETSRKQSSRPRWRTRESQKQLIVRVRGYDCRSVRPGSSAEAGSDTNRHFRREGCSRSGLHHAE